MGSELVDNSLSSLELNTKGSERKSSSTSLFSHSETFEKMFPYYLSIGMSEKQYWDSDPQLVKPFREAEQIRKERANSEMWLQGMYIYDAILRASPILQAFAKKGTKPEPYVDMPYPITEEEIEQRKLEKERKSYDEMIGRMQALMNTTQKNKKGSEQPCQQQTHQ